MDIEIMIEVSERGRKLYMLNDENLIELIKNENELQNYLSDSVDVIDETIARQSVKSEEVAEAITTMQSMVHCNNGADCDSCPKTTTCNDSNERHIAMKLATAALQEYQPWMSVKDRLPEDGIPVFVTYLGFSDGKPHSDGVARWSIEENGYNGGWLWELDRSEVTVEITHWKPLPEPPKGE